MSENNMQLYTMTDKAKRDELFEDLRKNGDKYERQAVKFSEVEPVPGVFDSKGRQVWRSLWAIAHPTERAN